MWRFEVMSWLKRVFKRSGGEVSGYVLMFAVHVYTYHCTRSKHMKQPAEDGGGCWYYTDYLVIVSRARPSLLQSYSIVTAVWGGAGRDEDDTREGKVW